MKITTWKELKTKNLIGKYAVISEYFPLQKKQVSFVLLVEKMTEEEQGGMAADLRRIGKSLNRQMNVKGKVVAGDKIGKNGLCYIADSIEAGRYHVEYYNDLALAVVNL